MKKRRKTVNLSKEVEKSFEELESEMPDNSVLQELTIGDDDSTLEFYPDGDVLQDEYDWLAQPVDDWQRKVIREDANSAIDWFGEKEDKDHG